MKKVLLSAFALFIFTFNAANAAIKVTPSYVEIDANKTKKDYSAAISALTTCQAITYTRFCLRGENSDVVIFRLMAFARYLVNLFTLRHWPAPP